MSATVKWREDVEKKIQSGGERTGQKSISVLSSMEACSQRPDMVSNPKDTCTKADTHRHAYTRTI